MSNGKVIAFGIIIVLCILSLIGVKIASHVNTFSTMGTVTEKERIISGSGDTMTSYYLVWLEDNDGKTHVFKNEDTLFRGKFDSSTIQGMIKRGEEVSIKAYGFRFGFLSWYPNILEVTMIE